MPSVLLGWLSLCSMTAALCAQQDSHAPLARYSQDGQVRVVTRADVALEMAFHLRRKDDGRAATAQLVKSALVRRAAKKAGVWPGAEELQQRWRAIEEQFRAAGRDLAREPLLRHASQQDLLDYLAVDLAHEQLVRKELAMRPDEAVSPAMLELWVEEARQKARIEEDPDQLPLSVAAKVDDENLPMLDLGMLLLRSSDQDEADKFVRQVVALDGIEQKARALGLEATEQDLVAELEMRRTMADKDPRYGGLSFDQLLKAQGLTQKALVQSRVFRAQALQKKIIARLHPREQLIARLAADRDTELLRFGPRRRLAIVFLRALAEPNALVPRDFPAALARLAEVRGRLAQESFEQIARIESDDPATKLRGGDCGYLPRRARDLPEPVLAAAFALADGAVSEPVQAEDGCYLVKVLAIEPDLDDDAIVLRMREQLAEDFMRTLLESADIRPADGGDK